MTSLTMETTQLHYTAPAASTSTCAVYVDYDVDSPPPHPGRDWTRFVCISDTHSQSYPLPDGDVLLHSGDLSAEGVPYAFEYTIEWLKKLPHPVKVIIAGNHDLCLDPDWVLSGRMYSFTGEGYAAEIIEAARELVRGEDAIRAGIYYLEHESLRITPPNSRTWEIYGSPAAPRYSAGAFQYTPGKGAAIYSRIPPTTEILLTHTPPYGIQDKTRRGKHAGCEELLARLRGEDLQACRLHVFGHIHESHGAALSPLTDGLFGRVSVNAAVAYGHDAIIVDLKN